jgi:hypothetical protein
MKQELVSLDELAQFKHLPDEAGVRVLLACTILGCSTITVWRLAKTKKIISIKISSGVTVFNVGSIRALLKGTN